MNATARIPVGISSCLLGEKVRYDGEHKRSSYCHDLLSQHFDLRPFCPEMAAGLGAPRTIIRLTEQDGELRAMQQTDPSRDVTDLLASHADHVADTHADLCGYIFTERSPSCGLFRVKQYNDSGVQTGDRARGIFAARLSERLPLLPMEEAERLNDADLCESFILRVYVWHEWHSQLLPRLSAKQLLEYWSRCKYLVLAHDESIYRQIGPLLATLGQQNLHSLASTFFDLLMQALARPSTRGSNCNVLQHLRGYIKGALDETEKRGLDTAMAQYRQGHVPLSVPLAIMRQLLARHPQAWASAQSYLHPYPDILRLRHHQ